MGNSLTPGLSALLGQLQHCSANCSQWQALSRGFLSIQSDSSQDPGQNKSQGVRHTLQPVIIPGNPCASTLKFWSTVTLPAHMTTGANTDWPWSQITSLQTLLENYWNLKANLSFISPFKPFHKLVWSYYLYLKASWKLLTKGMNNAFIARTGILN